MTVDPATIATLSTVGKVIGTVGTLTTAVQSFQQGKAQQAMFNRQAEQRRQESIRAAEIQRKKDQRAIAQQRLQRAASGVVLGEGSPLSLLEESQGNALLDELNILRSGQISASNLSAQGAAAKSAGTMGFVSGVLGAASSASDLLEGESFGRTKTGKPKTPPRKPF